MPATRALRFSGRLFGLMLLGLSLGSPAQTVYRIESPDGRVRFSDLPPRPNEKATALAREAGSAPARGDALPYALRELTARFAVTLYTGDNCEPCQQGRALLLARGIPYNEYTVTTAQDLQALQRLHGVSSVPVLTVGGQRLRGFLDAEWSQYLDAAGYPKTSALPAAYRNPEPRPLSPPPAPTPLSPPGPATAPATQAPDTARPAPAPAPAAWPDNPAGIRF